MGMCIHNACIGWFLYAPLLFTKWDMEAHLAFRVRNHDKGNIGIYQIYQLWCFQRSRCGEVAVVQQTSHNYTGIDSRHKQASPQAAGVHAASLWAGLLSIKRSLQGKVRLRNKLLQNSFKIHSCQSCDICTRIIYSLTEQQFSLQTCRQYIFHTASVWDIYDGSWLPGCKQKSMWGKAVWSV